MSVSSTINRVSYAGNGSTTNFSFSHFFLALTDLLVTVTNNSTGAITTLVLNSDYTLDTVADANGTYSGGAEVITSVAPAVGTTLSIVRIPAQTQTTEWVDNDADPAAVKELAFDKLTLLVQRLQDLLSRAMVLKDGFATTFDLSLPILMPANSFVVVNSTGDGFVTAPSVSPISVSGTRASPLGITASGGITPVALVNYQTQFIQGSGGAVDITKNPQIAAGDTVGQRLVLVGRSDTNTVLIENGTGTSMNGDMMLLADSVLGLSWDGVNWREDFRKL